MLEAYILVLEAGKLVLKPEAVGRYGLEDVLHK
jgi:hypothetical protein